MISVFFLSYLFTKVRLAAFGQPKPAKIRPIGSLNKNSETMKSCKIRAKSNN